MTVIIHAVELQPLEYMNAYIKLFIKNNVFAIVWVHMTFVRTFKITHSTEKNTQQEKKPKPTPLFSIFIYVVILNTLV